MIEGVEALIFDVDGTLAETEEAHRLAFNAAFAEAGLGWAWDRDLYRELLQVAGGKERIAHYMDRIAAPGARETLIPTLHAHKTALYTARAAAGETPLRPGIEALVREARRRGVALAIATTTSRPNIDILITTQLGPDAISWFTAIACGDMAEAKKPDPDVYRIALADLGVDAERALAIEDSANGIRSAAAAGIRVIATPSFYYANDDVSEATVVVKEPSEIPALLGWD